MEKIPEFIVSPEDMQEESTVKAKKPINEERELYEDYFHYFSPEGIKAAEKHFLRTRMTDTERQIFESEKKQWREKKYGVDDKNAIEKIISKKNETSAELKARRELQRELLASIVLGDAEKSEVVRNKYIEKFPDQLEGVMALVDFGTNIDENKFINEQRLETDPNKKEERLRVYESLTQYNFLLTNFIRQNGANKEFLDAFWDTLEDIAKKKRALPYAHGLRRGILSQVATYKIFERLGMSPKLSHPEEDAFRKVDIWVEGEGAVQVKGSSKKGDELFIETDKISFPSSEVVSQDGTKVHYNGYLMREFSKFQMKIDRYARERGENIKGFVAVVPYQEFDHVTGEPSRDIVDRSARSLGVTFPQESQLS
jgi:hypothetical protein